RLLKELSEKDIYRLANLLEQLNQGNEELFWARVEKYANLTGAGAMLGMFFGVLSGGVGAVFSIADGIASSTVTEAGVIAAELATVGCFLPANIAMATYSAVKVGIGAKRDLTLGNNLKQLRYTEKTSLA